ncbi:hypothetical protein HJFPF1_08989 [Paramyrothecium foliicola]|nr:hypothetical protein HJFPF1_08989 [Paramyrothecium foliicola]
MWLYENHHLDKGLEIWETMEMMFEGGQIGGQDWTTFFVEGVFPTGGTPDTKTSGFTHGVNLAQVDCSTDYPFLETLDYTIHSDTDFKFSIRVPDRLSQGTIRIGSSSAESLEPDDFGLQKVSIRRGSTEFSINLPMGPLPNAGLNPRPLDWVLTPRTEWRYAIDPDSIRAWHDRSDRADLPNPVFARGGPLTSLMADAFPFNWPEIEAL